MSSYYCVSKGICIISKQQKKHKKSSKQSSVVKCSQTKSAIFIDYALKKLDILLISHQLYFGAFSRTHLTNSVLF